ncbi:Adenylate/guanylate cyclase domain-containing protein [Bosea sp. 62]|uniref:adenylate/guanylate cyclase domain-containing protein n=1 Tax=unclassified Bosea (in: a-proteobacteria) TaxID=2653178 RepID=UPI001251E232|nr:MULTISPECIES: adenylate/guanylate cyclase domain-containing protein [unclassified Bosea (in: a-proteobacteria)]CAD5254551.1 Adenylate/guanylate cyclase domain-containing protein [Bosea sp. 7B]CAD5276435.1 Adenylate/guanylate cyclase domain-containing protein [Bosea sp. 21B]CAD5277599.1 Adenylate/guanylate cyclase domain-containing protein [Bosea sp. 46]VVT59880.1 Transcriptional regulator [Bosea sp. EC-HK365B]VXB47252.1 Adenylate/guanylate cyclase domain-containing protein [Bosea sp. 62]
MTQSPSAPRSSLFAKYFIALFAAVVVPLLVAGGSEAWFGHRDQKARLNDLLEAEARSAAAKIQDFLDGIRDQLAWTVQLPWSDSADERRRLDAFRLLRQVPAVISLALVDATGRERIFVSRLGLNKVEGGADHSVNPALQNVRPDGVWYGPVTFHGGSEPFLTIAVAGTRSAVGVAVAEVNLKLIWDVISAIRVGRTGAAFVLDQPGRLIAHPDISLVLRADQTAIQPLQTLRASIAAQSGQATSGRDIGGHMVLAAMAPIPGVDWSVVVKQPVAEAFEPIYAALWRTGAVLIVGSGLAAALAYWLTQRMIEPIRILEDGVARIGARQFDHRIDIATGDEFERLATRFNEMAGDLAVSQERSERIGRLKRFLAPQVAELVDRSGDDSVLDGRRIEVVVVFGDLRGFTAFSARAEPDIVMSFLGEYYDALDRVVIEHGATLTHFSGDGMMVLINAPVTRADPALCAVNMARDMQKTVQTLLLDRRSLDHQLGFGIGLAMGLATVGRIGSEGRLEYTAIGTVVNLASRLCASAGNAEVLIDLVAAEAIDGRAPLVELNAHFLKGFDQPVRVFAADIGAAG